MAIFTNIVKPTHLCNLACSYCFNDDVREPIMREETLKAMVDQTLSYAFESGYFDKVDFIWHGGEPMVAGLPYFEKAVAFQKAKLREIRSQRGHEFTVDNIIQTNATLINEKWAEFFAEHGFSVSTSIDGAADLHDANRVDKRGRGSFERVLKGLRHAQDAGLEIGATLVVSRVNIDNLVEIFDLFSELQIGFNVIPINKSGSARDRYDVLGLEPEEYAQAWIKMYDRWFESDADYVYCSDFTLLTRAIMFGMPTDCIGMADCGKTNISVDPIGDVYGCTSLSGHEENLYGNLHDKSISDLLKQTRVVAGFLNRKVDPQCATCKWQHICHGGCPARAYKFTGDYHQRDYYCPSLFAMYEHIERRLNEKGLERAKPHPQHAAPLRRRKVSDLAN